MKKLLAALFIVAGFACANAKVEILDNKEIVGNNSPVKVEIVDYNPSYKDVITEIAFQDAYNFFCGSAFVKKGLVPADCFEKQNRNVMESILNDKTKVIKVLLHSGKAVAFVGVQKDRELSIESMKRQLPAEMLATFNEDKVMAALPHLKKTDAECLEHIKIETLAVSKDFRRKGYAKMLLKEAIEAAKKLWPDIKQIQLDVNSDNESARKLYESEGFIVTNPQPMHYIMLEVVQYEKAL